MATSNILWTALPNGLTPKGDQLRLSVLVSPRLSSTTGTLTDCSAFWDWPETLRGLTFQVEFQGGPTVTVSPVTLPDNSTFDSDLWTTLFKTTTPLTSYSFDDRSDRHVRSFPTKKVLSFLLDAYRTVAIRSPQQKPDFEILGFKGSGTANIFTTFSQIAILDQTAAAAQIDEILNQTIPDEPALRAADAQTDAGSSLRAGQPLHAVPPSATDGKPELDFLQVRLMHQFLSHYAPALNGGNAIPLPDPTPPEVDFHKAMASLGQYPKLMRALGIVIDFEISLDGIPATSNVRILPSLDNPEPMTPWTAYKLDVAKRLFVAAPDANSDVTDGMLLFSGPETYDIVELDLDGAAEKALDFSCNMAQLASGAFSSIDTPTEHGLPSLRSAGFSAARVDRATRLVGTLYTALVNNQAITQNPQPANLVLHAEEVTRGYRIDVWNSLSGQWHSLCLRDGVYKFLDGPVTKQFSDEGFVAVATSQSSDGTTTDLRLPESLFRWAGWSLCAPRPGKTIGGASEGFQPITSSNPATTDIRLETSFTVPKGTLPRLRFGGHYQFRARAVDLAGNSLPPDAVLADIYNLPPQPIPYLRYEPVAAPAVILRQALDLGATPGESGDRIVIRSNYNTHIAAVSERHIAPPKTTVTMAELHGMLDTPAGPPDKSLYLTLVSKDGDFGTNPDTPHQPLPHPEAQLDLPYLPDPFAPGAAFARLPGMPPDSVFQVPFTQTPFSGNWPNTTPFRLVLDEGSGAPVFTENAAERVLRVHLPKAEQQTVALSCFLTNDPTTRPASMLSTLKIWSLIEAANPPKLSELRTLALNGQHWMLTPPKTLTLVHAVQQPLIEPEFQDLQAAKTLGQTFATLTDKFPISGKSTIKVDIQATWTDTLDDLSNSLQPVLRNGAMRAFEVPIDVKETVATMADKHEFHDTKHRRVTYTAVATTRFLEYFPDILRNNPENFTRTSQPLTISILNSARPAAPKPLYVIPAFAWELTHAGTWTKSKRSGGGLRVYLDRPWFSSGEGELLAAVLWGAAYPPGTNPGWTVPDALKGFVTQWGKDPIWATDPLPNQAVPLPEHFRNAVAVGTNLTLDELPNSSIPFTAVGHPVSYDDSHGRRLWFCDIEMDMGEAYFPFVRLALARYQPQSVADAHLSRVVLVDFAQLMPDRSASITFDPIDPMSVQLAINGLTPTGATVILTATLQTQPLGWNDSAWVPVAQIPLTVHSSSGPNTLWTAQITLPAPRGSRPFRLLIEEFETFIQNKSNNEVRRLVYADILTL